MGQAAAKAREVKGKPKNTKKSVIQQKLRTAEATGVLSLTDSKLKTIPEPLWHLTNLKTLDLSLNALSELPTAINALTQLKTLKLDGNQLQTLPDLAALTKLTTLQVSRNRLHKLDKPLPTTLVKLVATDNAFTTFPLPPETLEALELYDLSNNQICEFLERLPVILVHVKEILLDSNSITSVPDYLSKCRNLTILSLKKNRIKARHPQWQQHQSLSSEFLTQSNVQILNLHGNPLTKIELQEMEGIDIFLERRKKLKDKEIHGGLKSDTSVCGLD